jgi:hypothetical protein
MILTDSEEENEAYEKHLMERKIKKKKEEE